MNERWRPVVRFAVALAVTLSLSAEPTRRGGNINTGGDLIQTGVASVGTTLEGESETGSNQTPSQTRLSVSSHIAEEIKEANRL